MREATICHIARKRNVTVVYLYINIIMSACTMNLHLHDSAAEKENITNVHVILGVFQTLQYESITRNHAVKLARCCENNCAVATRKYWRIDCLVQ